MNALSEQDGNDYILENLKSKIDICVGRIGVLELNCLFWFLSQKQCPPFLIGMLANNAGVYGGCLNEWYRLYSNGLSGCDANVLWQDSDLNMKSKIVLGAISPKSVKLSHRSVEPFYFENPWSYQLKDKRVLVISPFADTVSSQFEIKDKLWSNPKVLPDFDLITYKNVQSIGNSGPDENWAVSLKRMQKDISKLDFDVAILGCGAYGVPLASYIKNTLSKSAIYIGGGLQILFGIKGKRWDNHEIIKEMYNEYWTRPSLTETPTKSLSVENGCYW